MNRESIFSAAFLAEDNDVSLGVEQQMKGDLIQGRLSLQHAGIVLHN